MKLKYLPFLLIISCIFFSLTWGCDKSTPTPDDNVDNMNNNPGNDTVYFTVEGIKMSNGEVRDTSFSTARIVGNFSSIANNTNPITDHGHIWSRTTNLPDLNNKEGLTQLGPKSSQGNFTSNLTNLIPNSVYYARAYVTTPQGTAYHPKFIQFKTKPSPTPLLSFGQMAITGDPNNTNSANPGETLTVEVYIQNSGLVNAKGVTAQFSPLAGVQILTSQPVSYGEIFAGASIGKTLSIKIDASAQWNTSIPVNINLKDDMNRTWTSSFNVEVKSPYIVAENLFLYYNFEDQSSFNIGQIKDLSGTVNGVVYGNVSLSTQSPSSQGKSCSFPGTNESYLVVPQDPLNNSPEFSFAFWMKSGDSDACILDGDYGSENSNYLEIGLFGTKLYSFGNYTNYHVTNVILNNLWHHIVITKDAQGQQKIYVDGALFDQINYYGGSSSIKNSSDRGFYYIGADSYVGSNTYIYSPYQGLIDNFRMYNRAITSTEVNQIYVAKQ